MTGGCFLFMLLGIPKGAFYYDYMEFMKIMVENTDVVLQTPIENNEKILNLGMMRTADEACLPIKLLAGQTIELCKLCDAVILPRLMKDINGKWFCPEILGIPELVNCIDEKNTVIITEPLLFNNKNKLKKSMWKLFKQVGVNRKIFNINFESAYAYELNKSYGMIKHKTLRNCNLNGRVLLIGHSYNIYDKWINKNIEKKINEYGYCVVTERNMVEKQITDEACRTDFLIKPFWEAFERMYRCVRNMVNEVDGIIYLSSFSCGIDSVIIDMLKNFTNEIPFMILKLDEHTGEAGVDTRLEAFMDVINRRKSYEYNIS